MKAVPPPLAARPVVGLLADATVAVSVAACAALWNTSFHVVPVDEGTWRGWGGHPGSLRVALACVLGVAAALLMRVRPLRERLPLSLLLLAATPYIPVWSGYLPPLLVFQGPVLLLLVLAVAALSAAPRLFEALRKEEKASAWLVFLAGFAFHAALSQHLPGPAGPQGDEPHYLTMTVSLLSDGDLDLTDEFRDREYAPFFTGVLSPHISPNSPPGTHHTLHAPGVSLLVLPVYAVFGYAGVRVFMAALAALAAALVYRLVRELYGTPLAVAVWAVFAFTPPLPFYTSRLYPEAVAVLPTAVFLLTTRGRVGWPEAGAAALAAASLPWLHSKMLPVAFLGLALTLVRPGKWGPRLLALAVFALSVGGLLVYFEAHYGQATLSAAFGPPDLALPRAPRQTLALFFDRQYGLFSTGPIWALALPGAVVLLRQRTGHALRAFLLAAPPLGIAAIFAMWWGGSSPPARFLLPALPALALCLAPALRMRPVLAVALAALGLGVVGFAADAPRILHNRADGDSLLLRFLSPAVDVSAVSPSFIALEPGAVPLALGLAAAFFLVWAWGLRGSAVGLVSLGFLAHAFAHRPLIDPLAATQAVLDAWTPDHFEGPGGPPRVRSLVLPLELPREPWRLTSGETRNSRRLSLPPGDYRLELRASSSGPFSARVHFHSGELILATAEVGTKTPEITVPLLLPAGAPGFGLTATGAFGATSLDGVRVRPEALAPRGARAQIPWLEFARGDRYRVPAGRLRVTVLDRSEPLIHGFLTAPGGGRFLVDGAPGEEVVLRVLPAGATTSREIRMRLGDGVSLGGAAVLPVQVPDEGALVTFSSSAP